MTDAAWPPQLLRLEALSERDALEYAHDQFCGNSQVTLQGVNVDWDRQNKYSGIPLCAGFLHVTTREDRSNGTRPFDCDRLKRAHWWRHLVNHWENPDIDVWKTDHYGRYKPETRTILWCRNLDYVVVLAQKPPRGEPGRYYLVTAYMVDGRSTERRLEKSLARGVSL